MYVSKALGPKLLGKDKRPPFSWFLYFGLSFLFIAVLLALIALMGNSRTLEDLLSASLIDALITGTIVWWIEKMRASGTNKKSA
ncbi:MAG: hypothetical protein QW568_03280 [Candidatus Anstonellaceae archaeon]